MLGADRQLFSLLVEPVLTSLLDFENSSHTIIFVPEAELYQVPFPSLFGVLSPARLLQQPPTVMNLVSLHDTAAANKNSAGLSECFPASTALLPSAHKVVFDMASSSSWSSNDSEDDGDDVSSVDSFPPDSECSNVDESALDSNKGTADQAIHHFYQHNRFGDVPLVALHRLPASRTQSSEAAAAAPATVADYSFLDSPAAVAVGSAIEALPRASSLTVNGGGLDALFESPFQDQLRRAQPIGQCVRISMLPTLHSVQDLVLKPPPKRGKPTLLWIEVVGSTAPRLPLSRSASSAGLRPRSSTLSSLISHGAANLVHNMSHTAASDVPADSDSSYFFHR
jgi:hypothetical protein